MSIRLTREELERHWPDQARAVLQTKPDPPVTPMGAKVKPRSILRAVEPGESGPWEIQIPGWCPPSMNTLLRKHWTAVTRAKRATNETVLAACLHCGTPRADGRRRRASLRLTLPRGRRAPDHDNLLKCLYDGLVQAGALEDDGPDWCETGTFSVECGKLSTTLVLESI